MFLFTAVISTTLYATIKTGGPTESQRISFDTLFEDVSFISSLLKYEFVFTSAPIMENINKTVLEMVDSGTLVVSEEEGIPGQGAFVGDRRRRWVGLSTEERRIGRENFGIFGHKQYVFYCFENRFLLFLVMAVYRDVLACISQFILFGSGYNGSYNEGLGG